MSYRVAALRTVSSLATKSANSFKKATDTPTSLLNRSIKKFSRIGAKKTIRSVQAKRSANAVRRGYRQLSSIQSAAKLKSLSDPKNKAKYASEANRAKFKTTANTASYIAKLKKY